MTSHRRIVRFLPAAAAAAGALALWYLARDDGRPAGRLEPPAAAAASAAEAALAEKPGEPRRSPAPTPVGTGVARPASAPGAPEPAAASDATALAVRSTLGLSLPRVFYADGEGIERQIALAPDGTCRVPRVPPFRLRAPGHREITVTAAGDVAVEPVIGVVLRAPRLLKRTVRARLLWSPIENDPEHEGWVVCGFAGADDFAVALDPRGQPEPDPDMGWVPIDLQTVDLRLVEVRISRRVEGTFTRALDLGEHAPATLVLAPGARCPEGCEAPLERSLWLWSPGARERRTMTTVEEPWGSLAVTTEWCPFRPAAAEEALMPGAEYGVGLRCPTCGAYARRFVVAQPGENRVDLPLEERGTVLLTRVDRDRWSDVRVGWEAAWAPGRLAEHVAGFGWRGDGSFPVGDDGVVRLVLPARIPLRRDCAWPMPPAAKLTFRADLAGELEVWTELPPGDVVDLGRLSFDARSPHAVLAAGHGMNDPSHAGVAAGARTALLRVVEHRLRASGEREIRFKEDEELRLAFDRGWPPPHLLLADLEGALRAFALRGDRFAALPEVRRSLRVEAGPLGLPGDPAELFAGVVWEGIEVHFNRVLPAPRPDRPVEWTLVWPAGAEELWWTPGSRWPRPVERARVALDATTERLELR